MKKNIIFDIKELDSNISINNGEIIAICGRPAIGKTALALTVIFNNLEQEKNSKCLLVSFDSGTNELTAKFDAFFMNNKPVFDDNYLPCSGIINWLFEEKLIINEEISTPTEQVSQQIKKLAKLNKIDFVIIDYLQLMLSSKQFLSRQEELFEIVKVLKETAQETNLPIIITSQIPRLNTTATPTTIFSNTNISSKIDKFIILQNFNNESNTNNITPINVDIYNNQNVKISTVIGFNNKTLKFINI